MTIIVELSWHTFDDKELYGFFVGNQFITLGILYPLEFNTSNPTKWFGDVGKYKSVVFDFDKQVVKDLIVNHVEVHQKQLINPSE